MKPKWFWALLLLIAWPAQAEVRITPRPGSENPVAAGQLAWLDVSGIEAADLKGATVHSRPSRDATVIPGVGWDGKPFLLVQGARAGEIWLAVCVAIDKGRLDTAEYVVQVGSGPDPDPDPDPDPPPPPPPTDLAKWIATEAARVGFPKDLARRWVEAIDTVLAGTHDTAAGFRAAMREAGHNAMGFELWTEWDAKFDDPILTPKLAELLAGKVDSVEAHVTVWKQVAEGLRTHGGKSQRVESYDQGVKMRVEDPVAIVLFGSPGCIPCREMATSLLALKRLGYGCYYADVGRCAKLATECRVDALPHTVLAIDGRAWQQVVGSIGLDRLKDWYAEGEAEWLKRHPDETLPRKVPRATQSSQAAPAVVERVYYVQGRSGGYYQTAQPPMAYVAPVVYQRTAPYQYTGFAASRPVVSGCPSCRR